MEQFIEKVVSLNNPKTIFLICGACIFTDILTGYIKAFKNRKVNSSISRDGYIKKIGWIVSLLFGFLIDFLVGVNIFLIGSAVVCITTEAISVYENLGEIGVNIPLKQYFVKLSELNKESESNEYNRK